MPRRKRKPLLRAKRKRNRKREKKSERDKKGLSYSRFTQAVPLPYQRREEGSSVVRERREIYTRSLRGLLLPGGRPDTCSKHIVVKRLPTGPLMARDDILQVGRRGCTHRRATVYTRRMCCAQTRMQADATDTPRTKRTWSQLSRKCRVESLDVEVCLLRYTLCIIILLTFLYNPR